jgi:FixJ family two-component response regulator
MHGDPGTPGVLYLYPKDWYKSLLTGITAHSKDLDTGSISNYRCFASEFERRSFMQDFYRNTELVPSSRVCRNRLSLQPNRTAIESLSDVVYLVDDDPFLREELSRGLTASGTVVIAFSSTTEYLAFSGEDAAACVIINRQMPDLSRLELQSHAVKARRPVIFISEPCGVASAVCAMKAGALDFLTKPVDLPALLAAIRTGLAEDRRLRERKAEVAELKARVCLLTPREREVLPLVIGGFLNKQAASILGISEVTLQIHRSQVMRKMQAESLASLVRMAMKLRIPHWSEQRKSSVAPQSA